MTHTSHPEDTRPTQVIVFYEPADLAASEGIRFRPHQPVKRPEPILVGDLPDEKGQVGLYGTVLQDPWSGKFRMWYTGYYPRYLARYAESDDGLVWTKPKVSNPAWVTELGTNAVMPGQFPVIILHPDAEEPVDRYWMFHWNGMMNLYRSKDGFKWERHPARWNPVWPLEAGEGLGEVPIAFWDPTRREYIAMTRIWAGPHPRANDRSWDPDRGEYVRLTGSSVRMIGRGSSPDGIFWTGPDIVYNCDNLDPLGSQPYELAAWPYAGRHLGLLGILHSGRHPDRSITDTLRLYLAWSTDGCYTWSRLHDRLYEFIPLSPDGAWDGGMITQPARMIEVGDEWWCYYGGHSSRHVATTENVRSGVGLATMPKGRLISLTTDSTAVALTHRCVPGPGMFWVNADARSGRLTVSVEKPADTQGGSQDLPEGESDPVSGNGVRLPVTWNGRRWRPAGAVPAVRIRFHLERGAHLWECGWE